MRTVFSALILSLCITFIFAQYKFTNDPLNPVNPNFNYPEVTVVNNAAAGIPYQGKIHTGYLTVNNNTQSKLFYMLFPAGGSQNPSADVNNSAPLILWMQGGPGCSDGTGNYQEIGPFTVVNNSGVLIPTLQPINWNDDYNLLFIDNPVGVGYSVSGNERPNNAMDAVAYVQIFLIRFFQLYPSLYANDFYIFGESFGGHYIPALASVIVQNNTNNGIKIKGIGVGDGWTDPYVQVGSFSEFPYATSNLDEKSRDVIYNYEILAREAIKAGDYSTGSKHFDDITNFLGEINANLSPYNFEVYNQPDGAYPDWLNLAAVKSALGVDPNVTFQDCVDQTYFDFYNDIGQSYVSNYSYLLTQNVVPGLKVMLYSGQNDIICNTAGTLNYMTTFDWSGINSWINSQKTILKLDDGTVIGNYKSYQQLTFAVIYNAGHMLPMDQPAPARKMLDSFINNKWAQGTKPTKSIITE